MVQQPSNSTSPPTRSNVSLKGSSRIISEFFEYSINTILYQRGIYPAEDFSQVRKYDLNMVVTIDPSVKVYIKKIMVQLHKWLIGGKISKLIVAITDKESGEVVERWEFNVEQVGEAMGSSTGGVTTDPSANANTASAKSQDEIQKEIQAIIRQITASVTFLPLLDPGSCTFNVLVYAQGDAQVPSEWADSDAKEVKDAEQLQFRSFSTDAYSVNALVAYKLG